MEIWAKTERCEDLFRYGEVQARSTTLNLNSTCKNNSHNSIQMSHKNAWGGSGDLKVRLQQIIVIQTTS
jgi:hypothetical protein